jgi:hypothetical protein
MLEFVVAVMAAGYVAKAWVKQVGVVDVVDVIDPYDGAIRKI